MNYAPLILIVDDDYDDQLFLKEAVRAVWPECTVVSLNDGAEFAAYISDPIKQMPVAIFMDLNMPKLDGEAAAYIFRKNKSFSNVPIIIVSTSTDPQTEKRILSKGVNAYFPKPTNFPAYLKIVDTVCRDLKGIQKA